MSNSEETPKFKLSDDAILLVREIIQLSLLTGTNIVDHFRNVEMELRDGKLVPSERYIAAYNANIEKMNKEFAEQAELAQKTVVAES